MLVTALVLCTFGFVESLIISFDVLACSRGMAKTSATLSFFNVIIWFTIVKMAPEVTWMMVPIYALSYAIGSYVAIRKFPKK